jgi:flagellar FliJ protein
LEPVLRFKESAEEEARSEFIQAKEELEREERRLCGLEAVRERSAEDLSRCQSNTADPREICLFHHFLQQLASEIESQQRRVTEVMRNYYSKRDVLMGAAKEKKAFDKLKEKHRDVLVEALRRDDKKSLDAAAHGEYLRNGS